MANKERGGARIGAGAKFKHGEKTIYKGIRFPESQVEQVANHTDNFSEFVVEAVANQLAVISQEKNKV